MDADKLIDKLATLTVPDLRRVYAAASALLAPYAEIAEPDYGRQSPERPPARSISGAGKPAASGVLMGRGMAHTGMPTAASMAR